MRDKSWRIAANIAKLPELLLRPYRDSLLLSSFHHVASAFPPEGCFHRAVPATWQEAAGRPGWIHEIKHDGFRIMAGATPPACGSSPGRAMTSPRRFPLVVAALAALPVRSCLIDGEAIVTDQKGLAVFDLIRGHQPNAAAVLCAFDLIELDGEDLRRTPIETRKSTLRSLLRGKPAGIAFNAHFIADGVIVYRQACALGCEGIVSKRLGSSLSLRPRRLLAEGQKPGCASGHARGRGGLGK